MATLGASPWILLCAVGALGAVWWVWRVLERAWLGPRRLGRALRAQGLRGTAYRFPAGDMKEFVRVSAAAYSEPMPLSSHAVSARVVPFDDAIIKEHGKVALTWFGSEPRVVVNDPKLFREILSNKHGHFGKQKSTLWIFGLTRARNGSLTGGSSTMPSISRSSREIDVWLEFENLTGDVISRAAFGSSFSEGRRIFQLQSEQAQNAVKMTHVMYIPGYRFLPTKLNRRMKANASEVEALLKGIITKRERAVKDGNADNDDLLGVIKERQEAGSSKPAMTTEDIIGELKLFHFD